VRLWTGKYGMCCWHSCI